MWLLEGVLIWIIHTLCKRWCIDTIAFKHSFQRKNTSRESRKIFRWKSSQRIFSRRICPRIIGYTQKRISAPKSVQMWFPTIITIFFISLERVDMRLSRIHIKCRICFHQNWFSKFCFLSRVSSCNHTLGRILNIFSFHSKKIICKRQIRSSPISRRHRIQNRNSSRDRIFF